MLWVIKELFVVFTSRSWQILVFAPRPVSFIRIVGTHNTANEVFHCVHFECPCDPEVLNRYLEQENLTKPINQSIEQMPTQSSSINSNNNHSMSIESNLTTINSSSMSSLSKAPGPSWALMGGTPTNSSANMRNNQNALFNENKNPNLAPAKVTATNEVSDNVSNSNVNRNSRSSSISENEDAQISDATQATAMEEVSTANSMGNENVNRSTISLSEIDADVEGPRPDN